MYIAFVGFVEAATIALFWVLRRTLKCVSSGCRGVERNLDVVVATLETK